MAGVDMVDLEEQEGKALSVQDLVILLLLPFLRALVRLARHLREAQVLRELRTEERSHHKDLRVVGARRATKETQHPHGIYINMVSYASREQWSIC